MEKIKLMNEAGTKKDVMESIYSLIHNKDIEKIFGCMEIHMKKGSETPASAVIKTNKKKIFPYYTSNSVNCGIGLMCTDIDIKEIENNLFLFFKELDQRTTLSQFQRFFGKKEINTKELKNILLKGIEGLPKRYKKIPCNFEYQGNLFKNQPHLEKNVLASIPKFLFKGGRTEIGKNAGGNHFIELQTPIEIYDNSFGIDKNKAYFMVHLGTGNLGGNITGVYCHRKQKMTLYRLIAGPRWFIIKKFIFLIKKYGLSYIIKNYKLLFNNNKLDKGFFFESKQGRDFLMAENATMNYGYAWRYIVYSNILKILERITKKNVKGKILLDKSHNSILLKESSIYYTRNSCNMKENDLFTLPGDKKNHSYLCKTGEKLKEFDFNIDHGLGELLKEDNNKILQKEIVYNFKRRRYCKLFNIKYEKSQLEYSKKTFDFLKKMEKKGYFKIICKLKIVANLK